MTKDEKNKRNREYRAKNKDKIRTSRASNLDGRYADLKNRAKRLGRKFKIALATYKRLIASGCHYCGASLMNEIGGSLDRINNANRNYTTQNVVPCCKKCNYVKSNVLTSDEMYYIMEQLRRLKGGDADAQQISRDIVKGKKEERARLIRGRSK
jgi:hypothetical protein